MITFNYVESFVSVLYVLCFGLQVQLSEQLLLLT